MKICLGVILGILFGMIADGAFFSLIDPNYELSIPPPIFTFLGAIIGGVIVAMIKAKGKNEETKNDT